MEIIKHNPKVTSALVGEEICLFEPDNAEYIILNQSSSEIWELIKEEKYSIVEIVDKLLEIFNVSQDKCENETRAFISEALEKGILISGNQNES
tara:strand:- start:10873 stop:11154 length:282 start_codon:yes stop_codon:yes gene_type:complete